MSLLLPFAVGFAPFAPCLALSSAGSTRSDDQIDDQYKKSCGLIYNQDKVKKSESEMDVIFHNHRKQPHPHYQRHHEKVKLVKGYYLIERKCHMEVL